jgi:3-dehydroquinate dehydratase-1
MKIPHKIVTSLTHPGVVGTVHSADSLAAARKMRPGQCDWFELRVDNFFPDTGELRRVAPKLACPRIVTVRHAAEGGAAPGMTAGQRRGLYEEFLPGAGLVDIELRQARPMGMVIRQAKEAGVGVILSHHDFRRTPGLKKLRELARRAGESGADIFKVATMTRKAVDLAILIEFLADEKRGIRLAVMGMGPYGKISRLALARAGSCLNYGYLGTPNATGQWPVALLKARIAELREDQGAAGAAGLAGVARTRMTAE